LIVAVLDTNVIVSGLMVVPSVPRQVLDAATEEGRYVLATSAQIMVEVRTVLKRPQILARIKIGEQQVDRFLERLESVSTRVEGTTTVEVVTADPSDNKFLAAAVEAHADYVVSGDHHLLDIGSYEGVSVVSPAQFLRILDEQST
jgi:hypothetical protein